MNITIDEVKSQYLKALLKLKDRDNIEYKSSGICTNLYMLLHDTDLHNITNEIVGYVSKSWKDYSGKSSHPVPSTNADKSQSAIYYTYHFESLDMWNPYDAYGKLRLELLDFLISEFDSDLVIFTKKYAQYIKKVMKEYGI